MEPMVLIVWLSCLAVGGAGSLSLFTGKLLRAVAVNSLAAAVTIWIFVWLEPAVVSRLVASGGVSSSVLVAPIVMWTLLVGSAGIFWARESRDVVAA